MGAAGSRLLPLALALGACTSIAADTRIFEGTEWHVTAINGRTTPPAGYYRIGFSRERIGGQFGCNHFGGAYSITRDVMTTNAMAMTMMACPDPGATFEAQGLAVLQQPMRMNWKTGREMMLSNAAGSVELELLP
jgi:heat shock protein HslJ